MCVLAACAGCCPSALGQHKLGAIQHHGGLIMLQLTVVFSLFGTLSIVFCKDSPPISHPSTVNLRHGTFTVASGNLNHLLG